jgi:hypothetical protein
VDLFYFICDNYGLKEKSRHSFLSSRSALITNINNKSKTNLQIYIKTVQCTHFPADANCNGKGCLITPKLIKESENHIHYKKLLCFLCINCSMGTWQCLEEAATDHLQTWRPAETETAALPGQFLCYPSTVLQTIALR